MKTSYEWLTTRSNATPLFFILGPCVIEDEYTTLKTAEYIKQIATKHSLNVVFKSSFDKANRTSLQNYRGAGLTQGLEILAKVRASFDLPIITDIHETGHIDEIANVVDILQIPAFLCRQTDLLIAAGLTQKVIHVKKGQFLAPEIMESVYQKIASTGNKNIWGCERGYVMGYGNLVVDYRNFPIMKEFGYPLVFDATHSVQKPSAQGCSSGGDRTFVRPLAAAAVVQGIAGIFMEVHQEPEKALCDGPNSIRLSQLEDLIIYLKDLDTWTKEKITPTIY